jgi:shikimate kinase
MNTRKSLLTTNLVLIGMPGAGKSTLGRLLAQRLACEFIDTDALIEAKTQLTLQSILATQGYRALRMIEEQILVGINVQGTVIATGGSAPYSERGMAHLKHSGTILFVEITLATVMQRIGDYSSRGLACSPRQTLPSVFTERQALYRKYADLCVSGDEQTTNQTLESILKEVQHRGLLTSEF